MPFKSPEQQFLAFHPGKECRIRVIQCGNVRQAVPGKLRKYSCRRKFRPEPRNERIENIDLWFLGFDTKFVQYIPRSKIELGGMVRANLVEGKLEGGLLGEAK